MPMKIIKENKEITYIKEKSKFIGFVCKVYNKEEIDGILENLKQQYSDATHICYAYILPDAKKYFDDGEPVGTAGIPILDILEKNDLSYTLASVIRYFGGIKLGASGLVRAYSHTTKDVLEDNIKEIEYGYLIEIIEDYKKNDKINYLLKNSQIIKKEYQNNIKIQVIVNKKTLENLSSIHYHIIEEKLI